MDYMSQIGTYGAFNTTNTKSTGYYIIKYVLGTFTWQENTAIESRVSKSWEFFVHETYLS